MTDIDFGMVFSTSIINRYIIIRIVDNDEVSGSVITPHSLRLNRPT